MVVKVQGVNWHLGPANSVGDEMQFLSWSLSPLKACAPCVWSAEKPIWKCNAWPPGSSGHFNSKSEEAWEQSWFRSQSENILLVRAACKSCCMVRSHVQQSGIWQPAVLGELRWEGRHGQVRTEFPWQSCPMKLNFLPLVTAFICLDLFLVCDNLGTKNLGIASTWTILWLRQIT